MPPPPAPPPPPPPPRLSLPPPRPRHFLTRTHMRASLFNVHPELMLKEQTETSKNAIPAPRKEEERRSAMREEAKGTHPAWVNPSNIRRMRSCGPNISSRLIKTTN